MWRKLCKGEESFCPIWNCVGKPRNWTHDRRAVTALNFRILPPIHRNGHLADMCQIWIQVIGRCIPSISGEFLYLHSAYIRSTARCSVWWERKPRKSPTGRWKTMPQLGQSQKTSGLWSGDHAKELLSGFCVNSWDMQFLALQCRLVPILTIWIKRIDLPPSEGIERHFHSIHWAVWSSRSGFCPYETCDRAHNFCDRTR